AAPSPTADTTLQRRRNRGGRPADRGAARRRPAGPLRRGRLDPARRQPEQQWLPQPGDLLPRRLGSRRRGPLLERVGVRVRPARNRRSRHLGVAPRARFRGRPGGGLVLRRLAVSSRRPARSPTDGADLQRHGAAGLQRRGNESGALAEARHNPGRIGRRGHLPGDHRPAAERLPGGVQLHRRPRVPAQRPRRPHHLTHRTTTSMLWRPLLRRLPRRGTSTAVRVFAAVLTVGCLAGVVRAAHPLFSSQLLASPTEERLAPYDATPVAGAAPLHLAEPGYALWAQPDSAVVTMTTPDGRVYTSLPLTVIAGRSELPAGARVHTALRGGVLTTRVV